MLISTPSLNIAYEQSGPDDGTPILLLHGFPYDIRQFDEVRTLLTSKHYRLIAPYLRGFGNTTYSSPEIFRSGQQAAMGKDVIDLLDGLNIERAILVGFDWGSRAACVAAALYPERVSGLVSCGGYTIQDIANCTESKSVEQEKALWYQWYFQTERGRNGLEQNRYDLCRLLWKSWSPEWKFTEPYYEQTANSFENFDFGATAIHSYRHRHANALGDPALQSLEDQLAKKPTIACPTITLHGILDMVEPPINSEGQERQYKGTYDRRVVMGGHCLPAENASAVSSAINEIASLILVN